MFGLVAVLLLRQMARGRVVRFLIHDVLLAVYCQSLMMLLAHSYSLKHTQSTPKVLICNTTLMIWPAVGG